MLALQAANACGGTVFDPQLGREIGTSGLDNMAGKWRESQAWAVDIAGTSEDSRSTLDFTPPPPLISPRNKIILAVIGGFIFLYWLFGMIASLASSTE